MSMSDRYLAYRVRYLPQQLEDARRKVKALETEAIRYGMIDLVNEVWDAVVIDAQTDAIAVGGSIGFGDDAA